MIKYNNKIYMISGFKKITWTDHSQIKMRQYGLSKMKVLQLLRRPERKEIGIAPGTVAVMKTNKKFVQKTKSLLKQVGTAKVAWKPSVEKAPGEIWLMYADKKNERKIISTWRYPGVSKPGESIPIPEDIKRELQEII